MRTHPSLLYMHDCENPHKTQVGTVVGTEAGTGRALGGHWVGTVIPAKHKENPSCEIQSEGTMLDVPLCSILAKDKNAHPVLA